MRQTRTTLMKTRNILITAVAAVPLLANQPAFTIPPRSIVSNLENREEQTTKSEEVRNVIEPAKAVGDQKPDIWEVDSDQNESVSLTLAQAQTAQGLGEYRVAQTLSATADDAEDSSGGASLVFGEGLNGFARHPSSRSLIIRSSEAEPKDQATLQKDLAIMSHILEKALEENIGRESQDHKAMGINVYFSPASTPFRSLFLDGYGAVFVLRVGFPVLAPPTKPEAIKEESSTDSTWQEAERELYGRGTEGKVSAGPSEAYDEEKVGKLKDTVLEALKNASNIRALKPDESVTICVFGSAAGTIKKVRAGSQNTLSTRRSGEQPRVWVTNTGRSQAAGSVLTIRVKKADIDAFSKGKLELDDFRKRAKIVSYASELDGDGPLIFGSGTSSGFGYGFSR